MNTKSKTKTPFEGLRKILISLKRDIHRRNIFFKQDLTSDFYIFDAVDFLDRDLNDLGEDFDISTFEKMYGRKPTKGEIGCTLSHLAIYKKVVSDINIDDNDYILVCEDDALFVDDFNENLLEILDANLSTDIDILLLGQSKIKNFNDIELELTYPTTFRLLQKRIKNSRVRYSYPYRDYYVGTVAYLISKRGAKKIIDIFSFVNEKPYWLADDFRFFSMKNVTTMLVRPLLVIENPLLDSNLQKDRPYLKISIFNKILKYPIKKILAIWRNLT